jgi:Peptidase family M23
LPGGAVAGSFAFDRAAPYERGRRRGIDLRARPGARVLAVCSGVVTHAGRVPRWGRGVTLRCGGDGLVATELGLASVAVARDGWVVAGAAVGRLAARGVLRLGARVAGRRHGYVDPAALLGGREGDGGPMGPAVAPPPRVAARLPRATATAPRVAVQPTAAPAVPWLVPAGLALLAAAATTTRTARERRRRRVRAGALAVQR